jgi:hypothetical protein
MQILGENKAFNADASRTLNPLSGGERPTGYQTEAEVQKSRGLEREKRVEPACQP